MIRVWMSRIGSKSYPFSNYKADAEQVSTRHDPELEQFSEEDKGAEHGSKVCLRFHVQDETNVV